MTGKQRGQGVVKHTPCTLKLRVDGTCVNTSGVRGRTSGGYPPDRRKTPQSRGLRNRNGIAQLVKQVYYGAVDQKRPTFGDYEVSFTGDYGVDVPLGRELRRANAKRLREAMAQEESIVAKRLQEAAEITDRLQKVQESNRIEMQYLMDFGVIASHRDEFRRILDEVMMHGGMRLQAAADLAYARSTYVDQRVNGKGGASGGD